MKHYLSEQEQQTLDRRVADTEKRAGVQIVLAVVGRSDSYPELPWKAFALAASVAGVLAVLADAWTAAWHTPSAVLCAVAAALIAGAAAALLAVAAPAWARLFLDRQRAEAEARQYAESLFLSRELFATKGRTGILLFVTLFEHEVVVVPDTGLRQRLGNEVLQRIIGSMTPHLKERKIALALESGLSGLEEALAGSAPAGSGGNELPDQVVQEGGA
jgi:putative membrane protein